MILTSASPLSLCSTRVLVCVPGTWVCDFCNWRVIESYVQLLAPLLPILDDSELPRVVLRDAHVQIVQLVGWWPQGSKLGLPIGIRHICTLERCSLNDQTGRT